MKKLKQANLYQPDAIKVSGFLVERYNKCLSLLGIMPTKLTDFTIDGKGWSPEIATEKNTIHYLNNGDANSYAIIISPHQKDKWIFEPFHSFDKDLMDLIFSTYGDEIKNITRESALTIDFNQGIDVFYETFDLLKYKNIKIYFNLINDLKSIQKEQQNLVVTFNEGNNFVDEILHQKILKSVKKYGDLRTRNLDLEPINYTVNSFYTKAFDGVFVFKDFPSPILVFESEKWRNQAIKNTTYDVIIFHIKDSELLEKLSSYDAINYNLKKIVETERYKRIKKHIFSQLFKETANPMKDILSNVNLFKNYLNKLDLDARKYLMCVERYLEKSNLDNSVEITTFIYRDILESMYKPHSSLLDNEKELMWKLLVKVAPKDPYNMFVKDKNTFYKHYQEWDKSYQDWVIEQITSN
ncbi:MAG TPA: hypothetical protein EYP87_04590 [Flavobacteriaceae bacterium]|nr:hypothetical protein [Flavobacteriaceae bacterium]